jgi:hypothetical protein
MHLQDWVHFNAATGDYDVTVERDPQTSANSKGRKRYRFGTDGRANPRSAAGAMIGRNFGWAARMPITHPPSDFGPGIYCQFNDQGKQRHRYEATREAAMAAFAKSWRRE